MKIRLEGAELFHAVGRADTHDDINSIFSQFCENAYKIWHRSTSAHPRRTTGKPFVAHEFCILGLLLEQLNGVHI
jgi:hypothetical protein